MLDLNALGLHEVNLLLLDFPADLVDKQGYLDGVERVDDGMVLVLLMEQQQFVDVHQIVELHDRQAVEVLVDEEQLQLVEED